MKRFGLVLIVAAALTTGGCSDEGLCGEDAGRSYVEVEAGALALPGSRLEVCINDLCNPEDTGDNRVSVDYAPGVHPNFASWSVQRVKDGNWETLAGGEVKLSCDRDPSATWIVVDKEGKATITNRLLIDPLL